MDSDHLIPIFQAHPDLRIEAKPQKSMVRIFFFIFLGLFAFLLLGSYIIYQSFELPGEKKALHPHSSRL